MAKNNIQFPSEHQKELFNLMRQVSSNGKHNLWTVFSDFLTCSACSISNTVDPTNRKGREDVYMQTIKKYTKEEAALLASMLGELVLTFEDVGAFDVLGDLYCKLGLNDEWSGQFFTPMHICNFLGKVQLGDLTEKQLKRCGYVSVLDPAVGGGAMILGFVNAMIEKDINFQEYLLASAVDIDIKAVYMSYLQFSLLGIPAIVYHGNTLSDKPYGEGSRSVWVTPMYMIKGFMFKKCNSNPIKFEALKQTAYNALVGV